MKTTIKLEEIEDSRIKRLTPKEVQIIQEVAYGFTSKEIGARMRIAHKTVEAHRHHIMVKTAAKNFMQVVLVLYKKGIII